MKGLRVFIVDDDADFAESMAMVLESRGCIVEVAYSGEEAIRVFKKKDFDIAFMDVKLPGKNGVDSFVEIKKTKPDARVVMMTGYSVEQLLDDALKNGAWDVLYKPIDMQKVLNLVSGAGSVGILIIDDDPDFVQSIESLLKQNGFKVFTGNNGRDAIQRVSTNDIDVLILDLKMPVMDGLETYLQLQEMGHNIPTLIVTAYAHEYPQEIRKLKDLSVSGVLKKPFDPEFLLQEIKRLFSEQKQQ